MLFATRPSESSARRLTVPPRQYAILLFLGAGMQFAFSIMFLFGAFKLDATITATVCLRRGHAAS